MRNLWLLAFSNFGEVLNCYHMKDASTRTLCFFANHNWPPLFQQYCVTRNIDAVKSVPKKWISRQRNEIGDSSPETIKQLYAGSRIVGVVKRVKRIINNELNPIYRVDKILYTEVLL